MKDYLAHFFYRRGFSQGASMTATYFVMLFLYFGIILLSCAAAIHAWAFQNWLFSVLFVVIAGATAVLPFAVSDDSVQSRFPPPRKPKE